MLRKIKNIDRILKLFKFFKKCVQNSFIIIKYFTLKRIGSKFN